MIQPDAFSEIKRAQRPCGVYHVARYDGSPRPRESQQHDWSLECDPAASARVPCIFATTLPLRALVCHSRWNGPREIRPPAPSHGRKCAGLAFPMPVLDRLLTGCRRLLPRSSMSSRRTDACGPASWLCSVHRAFCVSPWHFEFHRCCPHGPDPGVRVLWSTPGTF
jgi:hypothetical protein